MALKINYDEENQNITPLGSDEIKSILKTQSESVFQDKNISSNSNFVKKSLIDIALDFETKEDDSKSNINIQANEKINELETKQTGSENINENLEKNQDNKDIESSEQEVLSTDIKEEKNIINEPEIKNDEDEKQKSTLANEEIKTDKTKEITSNSNQIDSEDSIEKSESQETDPKVILEQKPDTDETRNALDSVRDAVSQSIIKSDNETDQNSEENNQPSDEFSDTINKDFENFKNIFSSLSNLTEKAIYEVFQNKILEIANEVAGYQIDKMPDKFEKKIKSFLKNINCFEEKITIEVNGEDYKALSKIENFNSDNAKTIFKPNEEIARGDIILNCDGMHYSEKTIKKN